MICNWATWNPSGTTPGGVITPRVVIFHVTAGLGNAQPHDHLEWHFEVSLKGELEQQVDTNRRADANNKANSFAISVETEGKGEGFWTDAQLDTLVKLSEWCMAAHPTIKRQRCEKWDGTGFGYHVMWGAPGPWTPVAKSCPGPNRIKQFNEILLPRILAGGAVQPQPEEDDEMLYLIHDKDTDSYYLLNGGRLANLNKEGLAAWSATNLLKGPIELPHSQIDKHLRDFAPGVNLRKGGPGDDDRTVLSGIIEKAIEATEKA